MTKYNVLDRLLTEVHVTENPYNFELHTLFDMAMRINKKRSFLFVSKVLGKHLAVAPQIPIVTGHLLARRFLEVRQQQQNQTTEQLVQAMKQKENLQQAIQLARSEPLQSHEPLHVIGFAETATALGHAFFDAFTGDVHYIHTTREQLVGRAPTIAFEEEHSHASSHRLYADDAFFEHAAEVVLVDDEMTTGKTNRNIIRQLHAAYPHIKTYTLVAILDWRCEADELAMQALADELGVTIESVSLLKGQFSVTMTGELPRSEGATEHSIKATPQCISFTAPLHADLAQMRSLDADGQMYEGNYFNGSGRFALTTEQQRYYYDVCMQPVVMQLKKQRRGENSLVLGTGEFMFAPMYIAAQLGDGISYHSTTRSPIYAHAESIIYSKYTFHSPEYPGVVNYVYNIPAGHYDEIFIIFERILDKEGLAVLVRQLEALAKHVHVVTIGGEADATV